MTPKEILEELRRIEFEDIEYDKKSKIYYQFIKGKIPILISAPHGTKHKRLKEGKEEELPEDEYTSSIAIILGKLTRVHIIYVKNKTDEDSNFSKKTKYKDKIKKIVNEHKIKFLMDLHGARKDRAFKICVGVMHDNLNECSCPKFKGIIESVLKSFQELPIFNRELFTAGKNNTVTKFAHEECGIESA